MQMPADRERAKNDLIAFYRSEADARDTQQWIEDGEGARVPESRSAYYFIDRKVSESVAMAEIAPDSKVLEVGSSLGQMSFVLAKRFREVAAVDLSPDCIAMASRRARHYQVQNIDFRTADAEDLSVFPAGTFDGAFSWSVLRYVPDPERALHEIFRVLKPGGAAVVDFPNKYCPWFGPVRKIFGIKPHIHDRLFCAREVVEMMQRVGFVDLEYRHILFTTRRLPERLLPFFKLTDAMLERIPVINRLAAIILVRGRKRAER